MTWDVLFLAWELIWIDIRKAPTFLFSFCLTKNVWTKLLQHDWTKTKYYAVELHAYSLFRLSWKGNISDIYWFWYKYNKLLNMIWMFYQEYMRMKWKNVTNMEIGKSILWRKVAWIYKITFPNLSTFAPLTFRQFCKQIQIFNCRTCEL